MVKSVSPMEELIFKSPSDKNIRSVLINNKVYNKFDKNEIRIDKIPSNVIVDY